MEPVLHVCAFQDNYIWLIRGDSRKHVAIVDPGDADPVFAALEHERLEPVAVLCTHHHGDHVGGVADIRARYDVPVYGPARERIAKLTHPVSDGQRVDLPELSLTFEVLDVPGHTSGHVAYYGGRMLFCGDTLFCAGCGRLFGGTAEQMHASLTKLAALPDDTAVYSAHEYTLANLRFALTVEPGNKEALAYAEKAKALRAEKRSTLPSTIAIERNLNPFLRVSEPTVRRAAEEYSGRTLDSEVAVFAVVRGWKDTFRG